MTQSNSIVSAQPEALETTPLIDSERSCRRDGDPQERVRYYSPNSSIDSQLENDSSFSRPPRSFSAKTLLSSDIAVQGAGESLSPDLQCISSQQHLPRSELFCNLRQWVELRLENSGSVARDHLASERTFLAYMRTSLAIASCGVALVQLFSAASHTSLQTISVYVRTLAASTVIVGLLVLFIGITRYFTVQVALTKGVFPVARLGTVLVAMMLGVLVTLTFGILLAGKLQ